MLQCCYAFKVLRMLQCFFYKKESLRTLQVLQRLWAKTLKMSQVLHNLQIFAHSLNVAKFAVPS